MVATSLQWPISTSLPAWTSHQEECNPLARIIHECRRESFVTSASHCGGFIFVNRFAFHIIKKAYTIPEVQPGTR